MKWKTGLAALAMIGIGCSCIKPVELKKFEQGNMGKVEYTIKREATFSIETESPGYVGGGIKTEEGNNESGKFYLWDQYGSWQRYPSCNSVPEYAEGIGQVLEIKIETPVKGLEALNTKITMYDYNCDNKVDESKIEGIGFDAMPQEIFDRYMANFRIILPKLDDEVKIWEIGRNKK